MSGREIARSLLNRVTMAMAFRSWSHRDGLLMCFAFPVQIAIMIDVVIGMITSTVCSISDGMIGIIIIIGNVGADIRRHSSRVRHLVLSCRQSHRPGAIAGAVPRRRQ